MYLADRLWDYKLSWYDQGPFVNFALDLAHSFLPKLTHCCIYTTLSLKASSEVIRLLENSEFQTKFKTSFLKPVERFLPSLLSVFCYALSIINSSLESQFTKSVK